ncbi:unnamed protein product, partial [Ixodes pacificus]
QPSVPFSFGYDTVDEFGTRLFYKEDADASNSRTGSYGYTDPNGLFRRVNYVADAGGFRATVETNEPGTAPGQSADAVFNANPVVSGPGVRAPGAFGASAYGTAAGPAYGYAGKYGYGRDPYARAGYGQAAYGPTGFGPAGYGTAEYGAAGYGATGYGAAGYGRAGYGAAGYGTTASCDFPKPSLQPSVPFSFGYDTVDEFGTKLFHKENADASNSRTGSYGYTDPNGLFRRVNYVADAGGFRATVETNEPGTAPGQSADAVFNANPVVSGPGVRAPGAFGASAYGTAAGPAYGYAGKYGYGRNPYARAGYGQGGYSLAGYGPAGYGAVGYGAAGYGLLLLRRQPPSTLCALPTPSLQPSVPFSFGYDTVDEFGTKLFHKEDADASNSRTGSYGYTDANGLFRRVNYVADAGGFRATVETNEPGTAPGQSADAVFNANPVVSGPGVRAPGAFGASAYGRAAGAAYGYTGKYGYGRDPYARAGYGQAGYGPAGYGPAGYGSAGYGPAGYGTAGYDASGYGTAGYGRAGYGAAGYATAGY